MEARLRIRARRFPLINDELSMNSLRPILHSSTLCVALFHVSFSASAQQTASHAQAGTKQQSGSTVSAKSYPPELVQRGAALFRKDCSFCHGRDATGGESGPDLTRSHLVTRDVNGDRIGPVIRNGRPDRGMPAFNHSEQETASLVAFLHTQQENSESNKGGRKGVDVSDLQTGNVDAGKQYFNGGGKCATCHSPTGDLAGIASRYQGLQLEEQMLYPRHAKSKVTVTLASGDSITGTLSYQDEFTIALIDSTGSYRSWFTRDVQYKIDAPVDAHIDLLSKYTDDDIHNLMAYLQTLQ
jgi:cytochrome c oxidase cbb3-type subunit III